MRVGSSGMPGVPGAEAAVPRAESWRRSARAHETTEERPYPHEVFDDADEARHWLDSLTTDTTPDTEIREA